MEIKATSIEMVDVNSLIAYQKNMNQHTPEQIDRLVKLIEYQGFRDSIIVQKGTNIIAAGHGRVLAAKKMGMNLVPVTYQEFESEAQFYAFVVSHNAIAKDSWASLDLSAVNTEMLDLGPDFDIDMLGIKDFVIEPIEKFEPQGDEDAVPDVVHPITRKGDIWLLGNHRLMCGDSTMIDDVEKLMNGKSMDLVYTDPPYGINEKGDRSKRNTGLAENHNLKDFKDDSIQYAVDAYNLCEAFNIPRQIWWGANYYCHSLPQSNNWLVWDKRVEEKMTDTQSDCEMAWVKSKWSSIRIFRHLWKGFNKDSERNISRVHPTQKPIALAEWCFDYYKTDFSNVMDLFMGSGTTLIACEKKGKNCFGMELDEHYCDVIIKRWEGYTGKKATLELTNQTYEELKAERDGTTV